MKVGLGADAFVADGPAGSAEAAANPERSVAYFGKDDITREISMSGETWRAGKPCDDRYLVLRRYPRS